nr:hypothetical protein [uncultured Mediterraneibacter sp.]
MAKSPAHRLGQIIGDILEETMIRYCEPIAAKHKLYIDYKHERDARNGKKEVQWKDVNGNFHKLDVVLEKGGTEQIFGTPKAFIEVAWRRYKKHAKAKAQEISAAIKPLIAKYNLDSPFFGVVLSGEFTDNSLEQMKSEGFEVLYFSTEALEKAFASHGFDVHWNEGTSEAELQSRVNRMELMSEEEKEKIGRSLMEANRDQWKSFVSKLDTALERMIGNIRVTSLYGNLKSFSTVEDACTYISHCSDSSEDLVLPLHNYEITVLYSNGDSIDIKFKERTNAIKYLRQLEGK